MQTIDRRTDDRRTERRTIAGAMPNTSFEIIINFGWNRNTYSDSFCTVFAWDDISKITQQEYLTCQDHNIFPKKINRYRLWGNCRVISWLFRCSISLHDSHQLMRLWKIWSVTLFCVSTTPNISVLSSYFWKFSASGTKNLISLRKN